uniref:Phorbol-ester/DAG-type domain-containing protein n=1 Tax=Coturnix japonica TaxID=93934 RepID=A0A8C2TSC3_COTJA
MGWLHLWGRQDEVPSSVRAVGQSKDRMKEGKDKDARYTNGHLLSSITVSGMTMCFACNKSITAKEALSCPTCNVTIHNRCKDTLPNCTKVKQKVSVGLGGVSWAWMGIWAWDGG